MSDQAPSTYTLNSILVAKNDEVERATLLGNKHVHLFKKKLERDTHTVLTLPDTGTATSPSVSVPIPSPTPKTKVEFEQERETNPQTASIVNKILKICGKKVYITNVYSAGATIASLSLLLLYIVKIHAKDSSDELIRPEFIGIVADPGLKQLVDIVDNLDEISKLKLHQIASLKDWNYIEKLGSEENVLHFTVGQHSATDNRYLTGTIDDGAMKISGKPRFCKQSDRNTPEELYFKSVTHLHLSGMQNCSHYTNLILTKWHFPKVQKIKLHKMIIGEQEFNGLRKFIDRYNETLLKVEIDESYICPSPICDAGMIEFPNHDFQLLVTRRRESPAWVLQ